MRGIADRVYIDPPIVTYVRRLAVASRELEHCGSACQCVAPRADPGRQDLGRAEGRTHVVPPTSSRSPRP